MRSEAGLFREAAAVWPTGREREMNLSVGFRAVFRTTGKERVWLRVTGSSFYRAFVNGEFVGYGPARAGHGAYRVDEWEITGEISAGRNVAAIELAGYNVNGYALLDQASFVQAEVVQGGKVLAATGRARGGFKAYVLGEKAQRVERYSFQRPFVEYYRLGAGWDAWRKDGEVKRKAIACARQERKRVIEREAPYPAFDMYQPMRTTGGGKVVKVELPTTPWKGTGLTSVGPDYRGFGEKELEVSPTFELQGYGAQPEVMQAREWKPGERMELGSWSYRVADFGQNRTGFLRARVRCRRKTKLYLTFDELLTQGGDINWARMGCTSAVGYELEPGRYELETFEPYELRYLKVMVLEGEAEVEKNLQEEEKAEVAKNLEEGK